MDNVLYTSSTHMITMLEEIIVASVDKVDGGIMEVVAVLNMLILMVVTYQVVFVEQNQLEKDFSGGHQVEITFSLTLR